jgi:hypothetical protein
MQLGWTTLALLILAAAIGWFWQDSLGARERANAAAVEACARLGLQFLDGTVAFARLQFIRGSHSLFTLRRTYVFDYTADSIERRQGFIILTGRQVDSVGYARGEEAQSPPARERPIDVQQLPPASNVLSLEEWRARQRSATGKPDDTRHNHNNGTHAKDR